MILKSLYTKIFRLAENVQFKKQMKFKTPSHIQEKLDIVYGKDEQSNRFDIYYPKNLEGQKLPTILNIHGGGYIAGKKRKLCRILSQACQQRLLCNKHGIHTCRQGRVPKASLRCF